MTSYRKRRHIIESNLRLERRYIVEKVEDPIINPDEQERAIEETKKLDVLVAETIGLIEKDYPERKRACEKMYTALKNGDLRNLNKTADKCLESLSFVDRTNLKADMKKYAVEQQSAITPENKRDVEQKSYFIVGLTAGLLSLWREIRDMFREEQNRQ
jgi:hypothetical protein